MDFLIAKQSIGNLENCKEKLPFALMTLLKKNLQFLQMNVEQKR